MAKQHFYSRVPAKVSLFNKMDGYDTFAHSSGILREQIEKNISLIYDNKPSKDDDLLIQSGKLPTVYSQFTTADGEVIQSAVSFLSSDYTGERSSYMVHSLVLSEEEKKARIHGFSSAFINKNDFVTDLSDFDLTSFESKPITDYPEKKLSAANALSTEKIIENYDNGMLKRLIFALLSISCGKTKALYFSLSSKIDTFSSDCLEFLNSFLQIFPFHIRENLSFVTYVGDITKFSAFKIKCVLENTPEIPTSKGMTIHLGGKDYNGINDDNIAANAMVVDFFFELLSADSVRKDFIEFCRFAVSQNEALNKPNWKNMNDLILLFKVLSGHFEEKNVLPNDIAVETFIAVYSKNRDALTDEYRSRAMKCLYRYPQSNTVIPKNVFSKVSSMYSSEIPACKHTVMDVVLELIHTDVMRDKLFAFIKQNYDAEDSETRIRIMQNVCRVYYGGFLQGKIIEFFSKYFKDEPEQSRENILERLLLTIRTPQIQESVITFIDEFYDTFSDTEKDKFYQTFYEMLPEADELSRKMADIVDKYIEDKYREETEKRILEAVETDERRKQPRICSCLATKCGFTQSVLVKKIFGDWSGRKIFDEFCTLLSSKPLNERIFAICEIWENAPLMTETSSDKLFFALKENLKGNIKSGIFEFLNYYDNLLELKEKVKESSCFVDKFLAEILQPVICMLIPSVFDYKRNPEGISKITEIAKDKSFIAESNEYNSVKKYLSALENLKSQNAVSLFVNLSEIEEKNVKKGICDVIKKEVPENIDDSTFLSYELSLEFLKSDEIRLSDASNNLKDKVIQSLNDDSSQMKPEEINKQADEQVFKVTLALANDLLSSEITDEIKNKIVSENTAYVTSFVQRNDKKGKKIANDFIDSLSSNDEFLKSVKEALNTKKSGGLFSKIFKK